MLNLTSGLPFGGLGRAVPTYDKALATPLRDAPGTTFRYSGIPLQVFGAVISRKLMARGLSPHAYLRERVLEPIGVSLSSWRSLADGTQPLPTGAFATAPQWLDYGRFLLHAACGGSGDDVAARSVARCFEGSAANPRYGLSFWLYPGAAGVVPYASGSGGQALYVIASERLVVVRFGDHASFKHEAFLSRLLPPLR